MILYDGDKKYVASDLDEAVQIVKNLADKYSITLVDTLEDTVVEDAYVPEIIALNNKAMELDERRRQKIFG